MTRPLASLSLDLDNLWSYLKVHGDDGWQRWPSYLDRVVPRILEVLGRRRLRITFFVVGQDAALPVNREPLAALAAAGHEIASHSFQHEPWMQDWDAAAVDAELALAEQAIEDATGQHPIGFRGPGFALSEVILETLAARGYRYDASTLPTWMGPIARAYYLATTDLDAEEKRQRARLFGTVRDGLRPVRPYKWRLGERDLVELPVTTMPIARVPIHVSYVMYLARYSPAAARAYFRTATALCRATGTELSLLLHPLDFLGRDDVSELAFFPAMDLEARRKLPVLEAVLDVLQRRFHVVTMATHAATVERRESTRSVRPRFGSPVAS